ncbi:uncharacterized protein LOC120123032 [Hibiscus syriacus]|uniref:uncharacterized protein LOC120123032 n=1 Tax=Hibiscus syriacus TaxID=106335 RepID=UPI00192158EE|nr:uncharacterized protein LOC120123032 [Hibiscus syriacus]
MRDHSTDIIGFVETRISSSAADKAISKLKILNSFRVDADGSTIILGDFNAALSPNNRKGCVKIPSSDQDFSNVVFDSSLHDLGYQGPDFTWYRGPCVVHLDRCLCNDKWLIAYPDTLVYHLLIMKSDHRPLLLSIGKSSNKRQQSQFRYFMGWTLHNDFHKLMLDSWDPSLPITHVISKFSRTAKQWKSPHIWAAFSSQAKCYGATNRRANRIYSLQSSTGEWCSDINTLRQEVSSYFQELFSIHDEVHGTYPVSGHFPKSGITAKPLEIKDALFDMAPLKSPRADGLHAHFYQKHWDIIGASEVIHSMRTKKDKEGWMAIKVDLEKAFDRIRWDFIVDTLYEADDLVLYAKATAAQAILIDDILEEFGRYSGHKVNKLKSHVYFSPNTSVESANAVSSHLGIKQIHNLGVYLGMSVMHKRATCEFYSFIIDKIKSKIHGWSARTLSFAGRITLANSVLMAIPTYFMQTCRFPSRIQRNITLSFFAKSIRCSPTVSPLYSGRVVLIYEGPYPKYGIISTVSYLGP